MQNHIDRIDIADLVICRKRISRAALLGCFYATSLVLVFALPSALNHDYIQAFGFFLSGGILFVLSLGLRKANRVAALFLMSLFILSLVAVFKEILVHVPGLRWSRGVEGSALLLSMFSILGYFLMRGVAAALIFKRTGASHSLEPFGFNPLLSSPWTYKAEVQGQGKDRHSIKILQASSEVALCSGAGSLLLNAILPLSGRDQISILSLAGFILMVLGVRLSLYTLRCAERQAHVALACDTRQRVLLLRSGNDELLEVRARISSQRPFISSFPTIPLAQVINENLSAIGPVVIDSVVNESFPPFGQRRNFMNRARWQQKLKNRLLDCRFVVMIIGKNESFGLRFSREAELDFLSKGLLIFPPVNDLEMRLRWDNLCRQTDDDWRLSSLSDLELKRAVLLLFRKNASPLLVLADRRDEWAYEVALKVAVETIYSDDRSIEATTINFTEAVIHTL